VDGQKPSDDVEEGEPSEPPVERLEILIFERHSRLDNKNKKKSSQGFRREPGGKAGDEVVSIPDMLPASRFFAGQRKADHKLLSHRKGFLDVKT